MLKVLVKPKDQLIKELELFIAKHKIVLQNLVDFQKNHLEQYSYILSMKLQENVSS